MMHTKRPNRVDQLASFCADCGTYLTLLFDGGRHAFFFSGPLGAVCVGGPAGVSADDLEDCPGTACAADCNALAFTRVVLSMDSLISHTRLCDLKVLQCLLDQFEMVP